MEAMRSTWTDSRLDDLNSRVDEGFRELRGEIGALQRTIIQVGEALLAAAIGLFVVMIGVLFTQL
jgi:tetrahydromethanopterin S-methyltransferase subunit G